MFGASLLMILNFLFNFKQNALYPKKDQTCTGLLLGVFPYICNGLIDRFHEKHVS
jgi:hypothetical protein